MENKNAIGQSTLHGKVAAPANPFVRWLLNSYKEKEKIK
jgi:hypothetical protein